MSFSFVLLHLAALMVVVLFVYTLQVKRKSQIYYVFQAMLLAMIAWTIGNIMAWYNYKLTGNVAMPYVKLWYLGNCYLPVLLFLTGVMFSNDRFRISWRYTLLFLPATISYLTLITNEFNGGLFFKQFSMINTEVLYGPTFYFHTFFSYFFIIIGIYYLLSFTIKNAGLFSRQSMLIFIAAFCPLVVNFIITMRIVNLPVYFTSISFAVTVVLLYLSIAKYRFLTVTPMATQTILDRMADGFAVINEDDEIIHYNQAFLETFRDFNPKLMDNLFSLFSSLSNPHPFVGKLQEQVRAVEASGRSLSFEQELALQGSEYHFQIDVIPIFLYDTQKIWGKLIFFKDSTQIHKAIETINRNQAMLMEQQHLATLGQLIGGIAHNLRTPIMAIAGGLESLRDLVREYQMSIGDNSVTEDDHREIAAEMLAWIDKTKPFCSYMTEIISAVKDQAVRLSDSSMSKFTVAEFLKRVETLMKFELKMHHCILNIDNRLPDETEVLGTMNNLIQIVSNIILNAIEAYNKSEGQIDLTVEPCSSNPKNIRISIRDYGPGIPESIQQKLFKEMTTSKGKKGTGLGLYLSYITIKGKFGGNMWFETSPGQGTTLHISVPKL
ncbi:MAG: histidine kinase N-terminal 7TM domain-containing protein [Syntrophomonadaceae bacterium]|nr:histidine kinase N-terminal 7TM domain-containing protein [Syntrophomonadaceae bacterium]